MPAGRSLGAAGRTWYVLVVTVIMAAVCPQDYAFGQVDRAKALEHYAEGGLHDARNDPANAIKSYLQALEYDSTSAEIHTALARAYYRVTERDLAQQHARTAVELDSTATESWFVLGRHHAELGRYLPARAAFERVVTLEPGHIEAHIALSQLASRLNDPDAALSALETVSRLAPRNPEFHFKLADVYKQRGMYDEAVIALQKVLDDYPDSIPARVGLTEIYEQRRQWDRAVLMYREIIALGPDREAALRHRLAQLLRFLGRAGEAVEEYRVLLKHNRTSPALWAELGEACQDLGEAEQALSTLEEGIELHPDRRSFMAHWARCCSTRTSRRRPWRRFRRRSPWTSARRDTGSAWAWPIAPPDKLKRP